MTGTKQYLIVLVHDRYQFSRQVETDTPLDDPLFLFDLGKRDFGTAESERDAKNRALTVYTLSDFQGTDDQFLKLAKRNRFSRTDRGPARPDHAAATT